MNHYYRQCQPRKPRKARGFLIGLAIAAMLAIYGWMDKRDAEPQLSVVTYDCAPAIEMTMPIQQGVML